MEPNHNDNVWNARTVWSVKHGQWVRYWDAAFRRSLELIGQCSPEGKAAAARKRKNKARRDRDQARRDCGLVRGRDSLGRVIWE